MKCELQLILLLTGTYFLIYKRDNINYEQISPTELRYLRVKPLYILN